MSNRVSRRQAGRWAQQDQQAYAWRLRRETTTARAGALFHYSLLYLALLFVALAVDPLL